MTYRLYFQWIRKNSPQRNVKETSRNPKRNCCYQRNKTLAETQDNSTKIILFHNSKKFSFVFPLIARSRCLSCYLQRFKLARGQALAEICQFRNGWWIYLFFQQLRRIELSFKNLVKQAAVFMQSTLMVQVLLTSGRLEGRGCWIVFQKRLEGSVALHHSWTDNKNGFGNLWLFLLGLDRIRRLTTMKNTLREDLMAFKWNTTFVLSNVLSALT